MVLAPEKLKDYITDLVLFYFGQVSYSSPALDVSS